MDISIRFPVSWTKLILFCLLILQLFYKLGRKRQILAYPHLIKSKVYLFCFVYRFPVMTGSMSVDVFDVAWVTLKVTFLKSMIPRLMSSSIASSSPKSWKKKWIVIITHYVQLPFINLMTTVGHRSLKEGLWTKWLWRPGLHRDLQTADNVMIDFMSLGNTNYLAQSRLLLFK